METDGRWFRDVERPALRVAAAEQGSYARLALLLLLLLMAKMLVMLRACKQEQSCRGRGGGAGGWGRVLHARVSTTVDIFCIHVLVCVEGG